MDFTFNTILVADIIELHDKLIELFGGDEGLDPSNEGRIDFIVENLTQELFGEELYKGLFMKASMLLFFLTKDHCFIDGNKRVAFHACELFLALNGYLLKDDFDYASYVEGIASMKTQGKQIGLILNKIAKILEKHSYFDGELLKD